MVFFALEEIDRMNLTPKERAALNHFIKEAGPTLEAVKIYDKNLYEAILHAFMTGYYKGRIDAP